MAMCDLDPFGGIANP